MKLKFPGMHNAISRNTGLVTLLLDDIIALDAGSICSGLTFEEQEKIQAVFITHGHYDHMMELPTFAFNSMDRVTKIFATSTTLEILKTHLIDGRIYPGFSEGTSFPGKPTLELCVIEPLKNVEAAGYNILPVPVDHFEDSVGFQITSPDGKKLLYTGDTGTGLSAAWEHVNPDILIIDITFPNRLSETANRSNHLCPELFRQQIMEFNKLKGYLPSFFPVHLSPPYESEIKKEMWAIGRELSLDIRYGDEQDEFII